MWLGMSQTLQVWSKAFRLTMNPVEDNSYTTHENLTEGSKTMKESRTFKTPKKLKLEETLTSPLPPNYKSFEQGTGTSNGKYAALIMKHIDEAFKGLHETVHAFYQKNRMLEELFNKGLEKFDLRITEVEDKLGNKPRR